MKTIRIIAVAVLLGAGGLALHAAQVQQLGIKRTDLLRQDLSVPGREIVQVRVDFAPGVEFGKHSHPGEEIAYVLTHAEHHWWDWYARYLSAHQNGSSPDEATAIADRYMGKSFIFLPDDAIDWPHSPSTSLRVLDSNWQRIALERDKCPKTSTMTAVAF